MELKLFALNKKKQKKKTGGRRLFRPSEEDKRLVVSLASIGTQHENISALVGDGISANTLRKHFARELRRGHALHQVKIRKSVDSLASEGNLGALIWSDKRMQRWEEKRMIEAAIDLAFEDSEAMTEEQIKAALKRRNLSGIAMRLLGDD